MYNPSLSKHSSKKSKNSNGSDKALSQREQQAKIKKFMNSNDHKDLDESKKSESSKSIPAIDISRITGELEVEPKKDFSEIHCFFEEEQVVDDHEQEIEEGEILEDS